MNILLVDDHPLILLALKTMVETVQPGVSVLPLASASAARRALAERSTVDLVLLDLQLGASFSFDFLSELRREHPELPVVVLADTDRAADVIQAIDLGAMGYLPKRMATADLSEALRLVMDGGIFVPLMSHARARMENVEPATQETVRPVPSASPGDSGASRASGPAFESMGLTPRQADVLSLLLQGKPNKDIARRLGLSVETVKDHVQAVLRALGVSSRTQAVLAVGAMDSQRRSGAR
jgi:DNA-binding NarL/FixJ family response regulator